MEHQSINKSSDGKKAEANQCSPQPSHLSAQPLAQLQQALGNRALGRYIQAKLTVSQPNDPYELEADRVADQVMRMADPSVTDIDSTKLAFTPTHLQRACDKCETEVEEGTDIHLSAKNVSDKTAPSPAPTQSDVISGEGEPLNRSARAFFEPRFGYDLSRVRVHRDSSAFESARSVKALAYTVGHHVVFGSGQYAPETNDGRRLIAHELVHVMQQSGSRNLLSRREDTPRGRRHEEAGREMIGESLPIQERVELATIARQLDPGLCASNCSASDGSGPAQSDYELTIYADKEGPFLLLPITHDVGHSWLKLTDKSGNYWTYGFWPQTGFDPSHLSQDVEGCVHHPDTAHTPTASQTLTLTAAEFAAAKAKAINICQSRPKYNLFNLQCTAFVGQVLEAAGKGPSLGFGLIWESPNALHSWIKSNSLVIGAGFTAATDTPGAGGAGTFALDVSYTHQFYSTLGEKLRFHWLSRGELSTRQATVSTGAAMELTSQRVFLPSAYVFGGGIAGGLTSNVPGAEGQRLGAGVTAGAGLLYNVDELMTIGVEYNLIKDLVNTDPDLNRLVLRIGLKF